MWNVEHIVHVTFICNHSSNNHEEVVRYLVSEARCSPNVQDEDGWTPLHCACRWALHVHCVQITPNCVYSVVIHILLCVLTLVWYWDSSISNSCPNAIVGGIAPVHNSMFPLASLPWFSLHTPTALFLSTVTHTCMSGSCFHVTVPTFTMYIHWLSDV